MASFVHMFYVSRVYFELHSLKLKHHAYVLIYFHTASVEMHIETQIIHRHKVIVFRKRENSLDRQQWLIVFSMQKTTTND